MVSPSRAKVLLILAGGLLASACAAPVRQELALSDEVARTCGAVASKMTAAWQTSEQIHGRRMTFAEVELGEFGDSRERCAAALDVLADLEMTRRRSTFEVDTHLYDLIVLDQTLIRSIDDPRMDSDVFAATVALYDRAYHEVRPRLDAAIPISPSEQAALVGGLLERWRQKMRPPHVN